MQSHIITDTIVLAYKLRIAFVAHWGKSLSMHLFTVLATGNPGVTYDFRNISKCREHIGRSLGLEIC